MTHIEATATFNGCLQLFLSESEDCLGLAWYDITKASAKCPAEGVGEWTMGELLAIAERHGVEVQAKDSLAVENQGTLPGPGRVSPDSNLHIKRGGASDGL